MFFFRYTENGRSKDDEEQIKLSPETVRAPQNEEDGEEDEAQSGGNAGGGAAPQQDAADEDFLAKHPNWLQTHTTIEHFDTVKPKGVLAVFVRVRSGKHLKDKEVQISSLPPKGSALKAHLGEDCLVKRAFEKKTQPVILQGEQLVVVPTRRIIVPTQLDFLNIQSEHALQAEEIQKASSFMRRGEWVAKITGVLTGRVAPFPISAVHLAQADALMPIIYKRLQRHIVDKVAAARRQHWCLHWVRANLGVMCALAMVQGHLRLKVRSDPGAHECLLTPLITRFIKVDETVKRLEGAYVHWHTSPILVLGEEPEIQEPVRTGKVAGRTRNFGVRNPEHKSGSTLTHANPTWFYQLFPSRDCMMDSEPAGRRGYFEELSMHVLVGFDRKDEVAMQSLCDTQKQMFVWPANICKLLHENKWLDLNFRDKQLQMLSFLWELFYELTLSTDADVSESPGFEKFLRDL